MEKDIKNNVVYVSRNYFSVDKKRRLFRVGSLKWLSGLFPKQINELQCKVNLSFSPHLTFYFEHKFNDTFYISKNVQHELRL